MPGGLDVTAEILTSRSKDAAGLSIIHGAGNLLRFQPQTCACKHPSWQISFGMIAFSPFENFLKMRSAKVPLCAFSTSPTPLSISAFHSLRLHFSSIKDTERQPRTSSHVALSFFPPESEKPGFGRGTVPLVPSSSWSEGTGNRCILKSEIKPARNNVCDRHPRWGSIKGGGARYGLFSAWTS